MAGGSSGGSGGGGSGPGVSTPEAATLVVSKTPGVGDYTTIQAALDALPAEGGYILIRESPTPYQENLTIGKSVVLRGCGRDATVIDIGSADNTAAMSMTASPLNVFVQNLSIIGDSSKIQSVLDIPAFSSFIFDDVQVTNALYIVKTADFPEVAFRNCRFDMPGVAGWSFWKSSVNGGLMYWDTVEANISHVSASAITGRIDWEVTSSFAGGGTGYSTYDLGLFVVQDFFVNHALFTVHLDHSHIVNLEGGEIKWSLLGSKQTITGSHWSTSDGNPSIDMQGSSSVISACVFEGSGGSVMVAEAGSADSNQYNGNVGFAGSTLIGPASVVNGARRADASGTTAAAYVNVFTLTNQKGLTGVGTVKNTGVTNTMTVKETATDAFGVTDTVETDVTPGDSLNLSAQANVGTSRPPYVSYGLDVKDKVAASHTTYTTSMVGQGAL